MITGACVWEQGFPASPCRQPRSRQPEAVSGAHAAPLVAGLQKLPPFVDSRIQQLPAALLRVAVRGAAREERGAGCRGTHPVGASLDTRGSIV